MMGIIKGLGRVLGRSNGLSGKRPLFAAAVAAGLAGLTLAAPSAYAQYDRGGPAPRHERESDRYYRGDRNAGDRYGRDRRSDERVRGDVRIDSDDFGLSVRLRVGDNVRCEPRRERYWVEPVYKVVHEKVWVEPVYRDEVERVWVPPVTRTVIERVWVPARHEWRVVVNHHKGHHHRRKQHVLVEPAHYEEVTRTIEVAPGRWEERPHRVLVTAGYFRTVEKRACVSEGRWDHRVVCNDRGHRHGPDDFGGYARTR